MSKEVVLVTLLYQKNRKHVWRIECPYIPMGTCIDDMCAFHNATIFENLCNAILPGMIWDSWIFPFAIRRGDWPGIMIGTDMPHVTSKEAIVDIVMSVRLPCLRKLAQKALPSQDKLSIFKCILQKRYEISKQEIDGIQSQVDILCK